MTPNPLFMQRCFDLARLGAGAASPNPRVGAVVVYQDRIIGEGYFRKDGGPHAEVMAIGSVAQADRHLLKKSTIYVSLEPCNIHGRTPPCTDLILREGIPRVVVAGGDLTKGVNGSGLERLSAAGVEVTRGFLSQESQHLSAYRNIYVSQQRPYVMLKYAQTKNGFIAPKPAKSVWLTNAFSKRLVHKWRTTTDAILVGAGTVRSDDPALTSRYFPGKQPLRIVLDRNGTLPKDLQLFDGKFPTLVFSQHPAEDKNNLSYEYHDFTEKKWLVKLLNKIAKPGIAHLTVEGGSWLLEQFNEQQLWDEARVFTTLHEWPDGLVAPKLGVTAQQQFQLLEDELSLYYKPIAQKHTE